MFGLLFASQNQKLVKKWEKEHQEIVLLAHKVIASYSQNHHNTAKKHLKALDSIAISHLMNEDIEFYRLLKDKKRLNPDTEKLVHEFNHSFKGTKTFIISFLNKYTQTETPLDAKFFRTFNEIVTLLIKRIAFEEKNLYVVLNHK
ncbi:MAG: hypothetical protein Q9M36_12995 [Sulfurovum sp.]|nr:hypothetical protein [Sulfurovum sp.]